MWSDRPWMPRIAGLDCRSLCAFSLLCNWCGTGTTGKLGGSGMSTSKLGCGSGMSGKLGCGSWKSGSLGASIASSASKWCSKITRKFDKWNVFQYERQLTTFIKELKNIFYLHRNLPHQLTGVISGLDKRIRLMSHSKHFLRQLTQFLMVGNQLLPTVPFFFRITIHHYFNQVISKIIPFFWRCWFPADRTSCFNLSNSFGVFPLRDAIPTESVHAV